MLGDLYKPDGGIRPYPDFARIGLCYFFWLLNRIPYSQESLSFKRIKARTTETKAEKERRKRRTAIADTGWGACLLGVRDWNPSFRDFNPLIGIGLGWRIKDHQRDWWVKNLSSLYKEQKHGCILHQPHRELWQLHFPLLWEEEEGQHIAKEKSLNPGWRSKSARPLYVEEVHQSAQRGDLKEASAWDRESGAWPWNWGVFSFPCSRSRCMPLGRSPLPLSFCFAPRAWESGVPSSCSTLRGIVGLRKNPVFHSWISYTQISLSRIRDEAWKHWINGCKNLLSRRGTKDLEVRPERIAQRDEVTRLKGVQNKETEGCPAPLIDLIDPVCDSGSNP